MNCSRSRVAPLGVLLVLATASLLRAEVKLAGVFGDGMVLQREMPVPVWGWADAGQEVTVAFAGQSKTARADASGKWMVNLDAMPASADNRELSVKAGDKTVTVGNVLVGEVWLCSGQSNMEWPVAKSANPKQEIESAKWPLIRHMKVSRRPSSVALDDLSERWEAADGPQVANFTAVGYCFARELHRELGVPVGLLNSSWGGTRIEPWTVPDAFSRVPSLKGIHSKLMLSIPAELNQPASHQDPSTLYRGMIHCLVPYAIRGALWYQGESNMSEGAIYADKKQALVQGWREVWGQGEFPFYYVQIAPYGYGDTPPEKLPEFWEAQAAALDRVPNTGMVVIHDVGNTKNIHPKNKQEVGRRLSLLALARTYGKSGVVDQGPTFKSMKTQGDALRVTFENVGSGLVSRDGKDLTHFEIAGEDGAYKPAKAVIDGDSVVLTAEGVTGPLAVRFGWHKLAEPNLSNKEGLPARQFRASSIKLDTLDKLP